jgi:hypothetical protein
MRRAQGCSMLLSLKGTLDSGWLGIRRESTDEVRPAGLLLLGGVRPEVVGPAVFGDNSGSGG